MALATTCPHCQTRFRVTAAQLQQRAGRVRCGLCRKAFDGLQELDQLEEDDGDGDGPRTRPWEPVPEPALPEAVVAAAGAAFTPLPDAPDTGPGPMPAQTTGDDPGLSSEALAFLDEAIAAMRDERDATGFTEPVASRQDVSDPSPSVDAAPVGVDAAPDGPVSPDDVAAQAIDDDRFPPDPAFMADAPVGYESARVIDEESFLATAPADEPDDRAFLSMTAEPPLPATPGPLTVAHADPATVDAATLLAEPAQAPAPRAWTTPDGPAALPPEAPPDTPPSARRLKIALLVLLLLAVGLQAVLVARNGLAARVPALRAPLETVARGLGLGMDVPRRLSQLTLEGFDLQASSGQRLALTAVLRNQGASPVQWPAMELTLTDAAGGVVVRRVLLPVEYLRGSGARLDDGMAARTEMPLRMLLDAPDAPAAGYKVELFYP